jgi:hypothetical protein
MFLPSLLRAWNEDIPFPLDYYLHNSTFITSRLAGNGDEKNKKASQN